jgi:hypothetical protein
MTEDVYAVAGMAEVLKSHHVKQSQEELKGVRGTVSVYRVVGPN